MRCIAASAPPSGASAFGARWVVSIGNNFSQVLTDAAFGYAQRLGDRRFGAPFERPPLGGRFVPWVFGSRAIELGKVPQFGTFIRSELVLTKLINGEPPKFGHVCDGRGLSKADEAQIATSVFPIIWQAHESSLVEAEKRKLMRDFTPILREPRAALIVDFFGRLTDMKLVQSNVTLRNMFRVLNDVIILCRADLVP